MLNDKKNFCAFLINNINTLLSSQSIVGEATYFLIDETDAIKKIDRVPGLSASGSNGIIIVREGASFSNCNVYFKNGGTAIFEKSKYKITNLTAYINHAKSIFYIDEDFSCVDCKCYLYEGNGIYIDKDNQWSFNIQIRNSDAHSIIDLTNNQICNKGQDIYIGEHCWLSNNVAILKGGTLGNNTIVGAYSVVTKQFSENNIIIAGNPARLIKSNVNWSRQLPSDFLINI